jgi:MFS family permease
MRSISPTWSVTRFSSCWLSSASSWEATASLLYLPTHNFWLLAFVSLTQAAMLAPLVPLADALALSWSRSTTPRNSGAFEYGWVRGMGSAAFIVGVLVAGQSAAVWGLPSVLWLAAAGLFATALSTRFVPDLAPGDWASHGADAWRGLSLSWKEPVPAEEVKPIRGLLGMTGLTMDEAWELAKPKRPDWDARI